MAIRAALTARVPWLRDADLRLFAELAALGVLIMLFLWLGDEVAELDLQAFDERILLAVRSAPDDPVGPPWVEAMMLNFSALGSGTIIGLFSTLAVIALLLARRARYAILVGVSAAATAGLMTALKLLYERPRPSVVSHIDLPHGLSFPSGHSMMSTALYLTLGVLLARVLPQGPLRVFSVVVSVFLAVLIGSTRVYLGVHYPTDVLAGWTGGLICALISGIVARKLVKSGAVDVPAPAPGEAPPGAT